MVDVIALPVWSVCMNDLYNRVAAIHNQFQDGVITLDDMISKLQLLLPHAV